MCLQEAEKEILSVPFGSSRENFAERGESEEEKERLTEGKRLVTSACGRIGSRARRNVAAGGSRERNPPEDLIKLSLSLTVSGMRGVYRRDERRVWDSSTASSRGSGRMIKLPLIMTRARHFLHVSLNEACLTLTRRMCRRNVERNIRSAPRW